MKKLLKRISLGVLGLAMLVGASFCFTACGDKTPQTPSQNPPYVEPTDPNQPGDEGPTDPDQPGDEDPTDPDQPGDEENPTDPDQPGDEDPTDPDQPGDDKDEEKYFVLAEIGEALEEKTGYEVLSLFIYEYSGTRYLSFVGKNDTQMAKATLLEVDVTNHDITGLGSLEGNAAKAEIDYFKDAIEKQSDKTIAKEKLYDIQGKYTTESLSVEDRTMANNIFNVLLADQTDTLGNYEILYGTIGEAVEGALDSQLGKYSNVQVYATILGNNGTIYNYSNKVAVVANVANPHASILQQGGFKETEEKLESIAKNALTKEYQQSVKDKAEYEASKAETASVFVLAEIGEAIEKKTGYEVLSIYDKEQKNEHYLAFYGIKDNQVNNVLTTIKINDYKLNNSEDEIDLQETIDAINDLELNKSYKPLDAYAIMQYSTINNGDRELVENVLEKVAGQDYQVLFATMSNPVEAIVDDELGNNSRFNINALLLKDGKVYNYSNAVQVATDSFDNAFNALLGNAKNKETEKFEQLGNLADNYQRSVKDKAEYEASKAETASAATYNVFYKTDEGKRKYFV